MSKKEIYEKILLIESYGYECLPIKTLKLWFTEDDKVDIPVPQPPEKIKKSVWGFQKEEKNNVVKSI